MPSKEQLKKWLIAGGLLTTDELAPGDALNVGSGAIDRAGLVDSLYTIIDLANPANGSGILTNIETWAVSEIADLRVGTFYLVSGTTYKCRDSVTIGVVTAGSKQTFSNFCLDIEKGDFLGVYWTGTGQFEYDTSGGQGVYYAFGNHIHPEDEATYTLSSGRAISIYAIGSMVVIDTSHGHPRNKQLVSKADFGANTILKADSDNTPVALTVSEQKLVGRITGGVIAALTPAQARTLLNVENGAASPGTVLGKVVCYEDDIVCNNNEVVYN